MQPSQCAQHDVDTDRTGCSSGLRSAALTAREPGISVQVMSDGPSRGATFVISLPMEPREAEAK
jgi:hypothetical protein